MSAKTQAEKQSPRLLKSKLLMLGRDPRGMSLTALAAKVGHPATTVSHAIHNPARFPLVRAKIERLLNV